MADPKLAVLLLVASQLHFLDAMLYFKVLKGVKPDNFNDKYEEQTIGQIKTLCQELGPVCRNGFYCRQGKCRITAENWSGNKQEDGHSTMFLKVKTCDDKDCKNQCWDKGFVDNQLNVAECCPKYKCGKNCGKDQFAKIQGYLSHGKELLRASASTSECIDICLQTPNCKSLNHHNIGLCIPLQNGPAPLKADPFLTHYYMVC